MSKQVIVDASALKMVLNALRRDAEEGKIIRGEMANELENSIIQLDDVKIIDNIDVKIIGKIISVSNNA